MNRSTPPRWYIGLAAGVHDSALAIVNPAGEVVFAEATERPLQYKRAFNCPPDLLMHTPALIRQYCEPGAELVPALTWSQHHLLRIRGTDDMLSLFGVKRPLREYYAEEYTFPPYQPRWLLKSLTSSLAQVGSNLALQVDNSPALHGRTHRLAAPVSFDHHLTHAATGCYTSPFSEAVVAVVDGFGEETAVTCYHYRNGELVPLKPRAFWEKPRTMRESLGLFYAGLCTACGFDALKGEEWKVMGLAAYGSFDEQIYRLLRPLLRVNGLALEGCPLDEFQQRMQRVQQYGRAPGSATDPLAVANLAHTGQVVFADVLEELLHNLYQTGLSDNLVYSGGCALNSAFNGSILRRTRFRGLHIFAAPADDGNAIGAALLALRQDTPTWQPTPAVHTPYLGSALSESTLAHLVQFSRLPGLRHLPGEAASYAAHLLSQGKIVGWVQGRAEFGPRALGNRSILADPRPADMKERLNALVKFREEFRPFAPAILHEHGPDYFEDYQETPYMERTLRFRPEAAARVPAVVHVDGTGRLQSVRADWNPRYHALLAAFYAQTGVPVLLNTSFNIMGKPMMHSVEDALGVFYTTGLDALVLDEYVIEKEPGA